MDRLGDAAAGALGSALMPLSRFDDFMSKDRAPEVAESLGLPDPGDQRHITEIADHRTAAEKLAATRAALNKTIGQKADATKAQVEGAGGTYHDPALNGGAPLTTISGNVARDAERAATQSALATDAAHKARFTPDRWKLIAARGHALADKLHKEGKVDQAEDIRTKADNAMLLAEGAEKADTFGAIALSSLLGIVHDPYEVQRWNMAHAAGNVASDEEQTGELRMRDAAATERGFDAAKDLGAPALGSIPLFVAGGAAGRALGGLAEAGLEAVNLPRAAGIAGRLAAELEVPGMMGPQQAGMAGLRESMADAVTKIPEMVKQGMIEGQVVGAAQAAKAAHDIGADPLEAAVSAVGMNAAIGPVGALAHGFGGRVLGAGMRTGKLGIAQALNDLGEIGHLPDDGPSHIELPIPREIKSAIETARDVEGKTPVGDMTPEGQDRTVAKVLNKLADEKAAKRATIADALGQVLDQKVGDERRYAPVDEALNATRRPILAPVPFDEARVAARAPEITEPVSPIEPGNAFRTRQPPADTPLPTAADIAAERAGLPKQTPRDGANALVQMQREQVMADFTAKEQQRMAEEARLGNAAAAAPQNKQGPLTLSQTIARAARDPRAALSIASPLLLPDDVAGDEHSEEVRAWKAATGVALLAIGGEALWNRYHPALRVELPTEAKVTLKGLQGEWGSKGVPTASGHVAEMVRGSEIPLAKYEPIPKVDKDFGKLVADHYEAATSNADDEAVVRAYRAMNREVRAQYEFLKDRGVKFEFVEEDPYKNSAEMMLDVHQNNRLKTFKTPGDSFHPLMTAEQNDILRAVHDYIAHASEGNEFGPTGEENAYRVHAATLSQDARRAIATETRGQNSWVNFGPHGEENRANPKQTKFAEQKVFLMPDELVNHGVGAVEETEAQRAIRIEPASSLDSPILKDDASPAAKHAAASVIVGGPVSRETASAVKSAIEDAPLLETPETLRHTYGHGNTKYGELIESGRTRRTPEEIAAKNAERRPDPFATSSEHPTFGGNFSSRQWNYDTRFYSRLARTIENLPFGSTEAKPAEAWIAQLRKQGTFADREMETTIGRMLNSAAEDGAKLTKEQVLRVFDSERVSVKSVETTPEHMHERAQERYEGAMADASMNVERAQKLADEREARVREVYAQSFQRLKEAPVPDDVIESWSSPSRRGRAGDAADTVKDLRENAADWWMEDHPADDPAVLAYWESLKKEPLGGGIDQPIYRADPETGFVREFKPPTLEEAREEMRDNWLGSVPWQRIESTLDAYRSALEDVETVADEYNVLDQSGPGSDTYDMDSSDEDGAYEHAGDQRYEDRGDNYREVRVKLGSRTETGDTFKESHWNDGQQVVVHYRSQDNRLNVVGRAKRVLASAEEQGISKRLLDISTEIRLLDGGEQARIQHEVGIVPTDNPQAAAQHVNPEVRDQFNALVEERSGLTRRLNELAAERNAADRANSRGDNTRVVFEVQSVWASRGIEQGFKREHGFVTPEHLAHLTEQAEVLGREYAELGEEQRIARKERADADRALEEGLYEAYRSRKREFDEWYSYAYTGAGDRSNPTPYNIARFFDDGGVPIEGDPKGRYTGDWPADLLALREKAREATNRVMDIGKQYDAAREASYRADAALENPTVTNPSGVPFMAFADHKDAIGLGVKQAVLDAVDDNMDRIAWASPEDRMEIADLDEPAANFIYKETFPSVMKGLYKMFGLDAPIEHVGMDSYTLQSMALTPEFKAAVRKYGLPLLGVGALVATPSEAQAQDGSGGGKRSLYGTAVAGIAAGALLTAMLKERKYRSIVAENAELRGALMRDDMTGLANKAAHERAVPSVDRDPKTSWVILDGNRVHAFNKVNGQVAGDVAIKHFGTTIIQQAEALGVPMRGFRVGGDEFAFAVSSDRATEVLRAIEDNSAHSAGGVETSLTGAIGSTWAEADVNMKAAKAAAGQRDATLGRDWRPGKGEVAPPAANRFAAMSRADLHAITADQFAKMGEADKAAYVEASMDDLKKGLASLVEDERTMHADIAEAANNDDTPKTLGEAIERANIERIIEDSKRPSGEPPRPPLDFHANPIPQALAELKRYPGAAAVGIIGYAMGDSDNENIRRASVPTMALAALSAIGAGRLMTGADALSSRLVRAMSASESGTNIVRWFNPDALLTPDVKQAILDFEHATAKGKARATEFSAKAKRLGPEGDRAVSDVLEGEEWEGPAIRTSADVLTVAGALAKEYEANTQMQVAAGTLPAGSAIPNYGGPRRYAYFDAHAALAEQPGGAANAPGRTAKISSIKQRALDVPIREAEAALAEAKLTGDAAKIADAESAVGEARAVSLSRRLELGEIREASYRASVGIEKAHANVASAKLFETLRNAPGVAHPEWVSAVNDMLSAKDMYRTATSPADKAVAEQLQNEAAVRLSEITRQFKQKGAAYVALPDTPSLGMLRGAVVQRDVAHSLEGFGTPSTFGKALKAWKEIKTVFNVGTSVGNILSNVTALHMGDVPVWLQPFYLSTAVKDLHGYGEATRALAESGVLNVNAVTASGDGEVGRGMRSQQGLEELLGTTRPETARVLRQQGITEESIAMKEWKRRRAGLAVGAAIGAAKTYDSENPEDAAIGGIVGGAAGAVFSSKGANFIRRLYDNEDNVARIAVFQRRRALGDTIEEATDAARRSLGDFRTRSPALRAVASTVSPFILYQAKAVPAFARNVIDHPVKYLTLIAAWGAMNEMAKAEMGEVPEQDIPVNERKTYGYFFPGFTQLPFGDNRGNKAAVNVSRWTPMSAVATGAPPGSLPEAFGDDTPAILAAGGPVVDLALRLSNVDPMNREPMVKPDRPTSENAETVAHTAADFMLPSALGFHVGRLTEDLDNADLTKFKNDLLGPTGIKPKYVRPGAVVQDATYRLSKSLGDMRQSLKKELRANKDPDRVALISNRYKLRVATALANFKSRIGAPPPRELVDDFLSTDQ